MKRTSFKSKTIDEVRTKQAAKRAKLAKAPKVPKSPKNAGKVAKRAKLPALSTLRNKTDALLTPLCKKNYPNCESCGQLTQVGHHWIEKSRSSFLRYDMRNLIALCNSCHAKIHNRFGNSVVGGLDVAEIIINKRGRAWKELMDAEHKTYQKVDRDYYNQNYAHLKALLDK
jgi:hypothetical protein